MFKKSFSNDVKLLIKMRIFSRGFIIVIFFTLLTFASSVFSAEGEILASQYINPGSRLYVVKRAWEKARDYFTYSYEGKMKYHSYLLGKRMSELTYVVENKMVS